MKAYIKKEKWNLFLEKKNEYGYIEENKDFFAKRLDSHLLVCVHKRKREIIVVTFMGIAAFVDAHKEKYQELINNDMVEYKKGKFD